MKDPFYSHLSPNIKCLQLEWSLKKASGESRIIHNLSYPEGTSFNDKISSSACSVSYASTEDAIHLVKTPAKTWQKHKSRKHLGLSSLPRGLLPLLFRMEWPTISISASPWGVHLRAKSSRHSVFIQLFSGWHTINKGCNI